MTKKEWILPKKIREANPCPHRRFLDPYRCIGPCDGILCGCEVIDGKCSFCETPVETWEGRKFVESILSI